MFHRRFFFGRIVLFMLLMGGLFSVGRGLFRSGYEQGFVQGMGFAAGSGQPAAPGVPDAPTAPRVYGQWRGGPFGPAERGFMGFSLVGFAFLTFFALMLFGAFILYSDTLCFSATLLGDKLDFEEFETALDYVAQVSDDYDDPLQEVAGGHRAEDLLNEFNA